MTELEKLKELEKINALKLRLPDCDNDELLQSLLDEAGAAILSLTGRAELPEQLAFTQIKMAAVAFNRMGIEGEASHSEGGVSVSVEGLPENIRKEIAPWRLARTR